MTDAARDDSGHEVPRESGPASGAAPQEFFPEDRPYEPPSPPGDPIPEYQGHVAPPAPVPARAHVGERMPAIEGVSFDRHSELNSRAVIGMVLSGLALLGILVWFVGFATPLLITVALAIAGIVMGVRGRSAARRGLATNGGLALAAIITGALAILGTVAIYALVLIALNQII